MLYVLQLIYIQPGQENVFDEFEAIAIPIISHYNGKMLLRVRPDEKAYIESGMERPYEIHLVEFATDNDLSNFQQDEERKKFLHLKEKAIKASVLIKGNKQ